MISCGDAFRGNNIIKKEIRVISEAVVRRCSVKKVFLKISQNVQEITCAGVFILIKLQASGACTLMFPVNFVKFLRTPFL